MNQTVTTAAGHPTNDQPIEVTEEEAEELAAIGQQALNEGSK